MKCIICRKETVGTDEHIIPDTLGGVIHCNNVCKECNSLLGEKIDVNLVNSILVSFDRDRYNLAGKKHKFYCWEEDKKFKTDDGQSVKIRKDNNGKRKIKYQLKKEEKENKISFIGDDKKEVKNALIKALNRKGVKFNETEIIKSTDEKSRNLTAEKQENVAFIDLALLKICYEFFINKEPKYYEDKNSKKISDFLYKYIYSSRKELTLEELKNKNLNGLFVKYGKESIEIVKELISDIKEINLENNHVIALIYTGKKVYGAVILFSKIWGFYKLSDKSYNKSGCFIITNNVITKKSLEHDFTYSSI